MKHGVAFVLFCVVVMISAQDAPSAVQPENIEPQIKSILDTLLTSEVTGDGVTREKRQFGGLQNEQKNVLNEKFIKI